MPIDARLRPDDPVLCAAIRLPRSVLVPLELLGRVGDVDKEGTAWYVLPRPLDVDDVVTGFHRVVATVDSSVSLGLSLHLHTEPSYTNR